MTNSKRLEGKRALVTGGSRGIGAAVARRLGAEGAIVAINYRSDEMAAASLVDELKAQEVQAHAFQADVSDRSQAHSLVDDVVGYLGGLDIVVSNAGIEHFGALETITEDDFDRVFHTNVAGQLFVTQAAVPTMPSGGRILLTSSGSIWMGVHQHALYAASKAAVSTMVRNLAPELSERGIAINAIAPGGTATDMATEYAAKYAPPALAGISVEALVASANAQGRLADPSEIAAAAAFLVSSDASYITGSTLDAAGGL